MSVVTSTITGTWRNGQKAAKGAVYFTLLSRLVDAEDLLSIEVIQREAALSRTGQIAVDLPALSDAAAVYEVVEVIRGAEPRRYLVTVPTDGSSIDLSNPAVAVPGGSLTTEAGDRFLSEDGAFITIDLSGSVETEALDLVETEAWDSLTQ